MLSDGYETRGRVEWWTQWSRSLKTVSHAFVRLSHGVAVVNPPLDWALPWVAWFGSWGIPSGHFSSATEEKKGREGDDRNGNEEGREKKEKKKEKREEEKKLTVHCYQSRTDRTFLLKERKLRMLLAVPGATEAHTEHFSAVSYNMHLSRIIYIYLFIYFV